MAIVGQNQGQGDDEMITEINVTPFVDVVLVLLILFMLAAPVVYQSGVRIKLPSAVTAGKIRHITLRVAITANGDILIDRDKVPLAAVGEVAKRALALDSHADAMLSADASVTHGTVLEVVDAIRRAGIRDLALGAETKAESAKSGS